MRITALIASLALVAAPVWAQTTETTANTQVQQGCNDEDDDPDNDCGVILAAPGVGGVIGATQIPGAAVAALGITAVVGVALAVGGSSSTSSTTTTTSTD